MNRPRSNRRPERLLILASVLVLTTLLYNHWLQTRAVPAMMRYVPTDSVSWLVTGSLRDLWEGARPHVAHFFDTAGTSKKDGTPMRDLARDVRKQLDKSRISLEGPEDLEALGIDPAGGMAVALVNQGTYRLVLVLPVLDRARLLDTIGRYHSAKPKQEKHDDVSVWKVGPVFVGFGADDAAVVVDDAPLLREILAGQEGRLEHHRSRDRDVRLFSELMGNVKSPAWLRGRVRGGELPLVGEFHFALEMQPQIVRIRARFPVIAGRSATLEDVVASAPPVGRYGHASLARSEAAAMLADSAAPKVLRLLSSEPLLSRASGIEETFPGLLQHLRGAQSLRRISIATIETRKPVPGVLLGLEMKQEDADALVFGVQAALRIKRDREILTSARDRIAGKPREVKAVMAAGVMATLDDPLWKRYGGTIVNVQPQPALSRADFARPDYQRTRPGGAMLQFLMPPFTADDVAFRFVRGDSASALRTEDLLADRYRMCSVYLDGTLWVATDADMMEQWLANLAKEPTAPDFADAARSSARVEQAKLLALLLPRRLLASAELHPDPAVQKQRRGWFTDLDHHRALLLGATPDSASREIHVGIDFLRY